MRNLIILILLSAGVLASFGFSSPKRPQLMECGDALPKNTHYSVKMHGDWDTRNDPISGQISITLVDEITGESPEEIPESAQDFVGCIKSAVGI